MSKYAVEPVNAKGEGGNVRMAIYL